MLGFRRARLESFTPGEVMEKQALGEIVLVDVREAAEFARGHIEGATLAPLSTFKPADLPAGRLVFYCAGGRLRHCGRKRPQGGGGRGRAYGGRHRRVGRGGVARHDIVRKHALS